MTPPADRAALDLLDAHLEALWDGTDPPPPPGPARPAASEGGELARWALAQLQTLPREPNDAFRRQVGSLLTEFRSRRCPWNAAALRLLDNENVFVATGPRRYEDWSHDVRAVLHRSVPDPRGRVRLSWDCTDTARQTVPAYPFDPPDASVLPSRLYPLKAEAAVAALAIMAEEWQSESAPVRSRPNRDAVLADARTLLGRSRSGRTDDVRRGSWRPTTVSHRLDAAGRAPTRRPLPLSSSFDPHIRRGEGAPSGGPSPAPEPQEAGKSLAKLQTALE